MVAIGCRVCTQLKISLQLNQYLEKVIFDLWRLPAYQVFLSPRYLARIQHTDLVDTALHYEPESPSA